MSPRKFYRTIYSVEILSQEPIPGELDLHTVLGMAQDGDYSGRNVKTCQDEINAKDAATFLKVHGSEPAFFSIDDEGNEIQN